MWQGVSPSCASRCNDRLVATTGEGLASVASGIVGSNWACGRHLLKAADHDAFHSIVQLLEVRVPLPHHSVRRTACNAQRRHIRPTTHTRSHGQRLFAVLPSLSVPTRTARAASWHSTVLAARAARLMSRLVIPHHDRPTASEARLDPLRAAVAHRERPAVERRSAWAWRVDAARADSCSRALSSTLRGTHSLVGRDGGRMLWPLLRG